MTNGSVTGDLQADESRMSWPDTGICVRARNNVGTWSSFDIAHLDRRSLINWLRSLQGRSENVVLLLLGHSAHSASITPKDSP